MIKLKNLLKYNIFLAVLVFITIIYSYNYVINSKYYSKYNLNDNYIEGYIKDIKKTDNKISVIVNDVIIIFYNCTDNEFKIGDYIAVWGKFMVPNNNTIPNLFNYQRYLYSINIHYILKSSNYKIVDRKVPLVYKIKRKIINYLSKYKNKDYLLTFILGCNYYLDDDVLSSYRINGISHLFALSGMHVSLLTLIFLFLLKKIMKEKSAYCVCIIFLIFYLFLTSFAKSILRASLIFIIITIKNFFNLNISVKKIYVFLICIMFLINPYNMFNNSFLYSYLVSFALIIYSKIIKKYNNYFIKVFVISFIAFYASLPITINNYYEINMLAPFINVFFVPLITFVIFPLTLFSSIFPIFLSILNKLIIIMENTSSILSKINIFKIIIPRMNILSIIIYYLIFIFVMYKIKSNNYKYIFVLLGYIFLLNNIKTFRDYSILSLINVGQGDSILIDYKTNNGTILIDTGGTYNYNISLNSIIPYLKSLGIKKIDYLILTHGDFDHMGEAINLVNNFKVDKVIFNCGSYNDLEKELIRVLDKKKIPYYSCIKELNIDKNKLYFLQTKEYDNENDNSNVIYTEINGYKFMFMGDASITTEEEILDKYNLPDIDVLKVGHHGSKTSSSEAFINEINPKYSIISVGKNNRYGHPNREVLDNLDNSKIYRTDQDGSIMFRIKNDKLKVETCGP